MEKLNFYFVSYNWIYAIETVFVNLDGSCALMRFNVAFETLSLNNFDKLSWMQQAIKVHRANCFFVKYFFISKSLFYLVNKFYGDL